MNRLPEAELGSQLPRLLFVEDIAKLFRISVKTVQYYTSNKKTRGHMLPRSFKFAGQRRNVWLESDVTEFLLQCRAAHPGIKRRPGRPKKAEQIRSRQAEGAGHEGS